MLLVRRASPGCNFPAVNRGRRPAITGESGDRDLSARIRRLFDRVNKAMEVNRGIERRQAILTGPDRLGEQGLHLPDVERIAAREVVRDVYETLGYG